MSDADSSSLQQDPDKSWRTKKKCLLTFAALSLIVLLIVLLVVLLQPGSSNSDSPVVTISTGQIQGTNEGSVSRYLGIPYASPPSGENRWMPPRPAVNWTGIRKTTEFGSPCPQLGTPLSGPPLPDQSEDCLFINIFTPKGFSSTSNFSVMFYIHGGAYIMGAGGNPFYDGQTIVANSQQVVVVTINYRLGVFGYLALQELMDESPENSTGTYGIQDMLFALRWVQENIKQFGGDPNKVTIWGESAGCYAVLTLLTTSYSHGLFHAAMCDSGGSYNLALSMSDAMTQGMYVLNQSNCPTTNYLSCLRNQSVDVLINSYAYCMGLPAVDGVYVPDFPFNSIATDNYNQVPLLLGANADEGSAFCTDFYDIPDDQYESMVSLFASSLGLNQSAVEELYTLYPLSDYVNKTPSLYWGMSDMLGDELFKCGTRRYLREMNKNYPTLPLYAYVFGYPDTPPTLLYNWTKPLGAFHGADLLYIFQNQPINGSITGFTTMMQKYWISMMVTQNPSSEWPVFNYSAGNSNNIYLDLQTRIDTTYMNTTKCNFWDANPPLPTLCRLS